MKTKSEKLVEARRLLTGKRERKTWVVTCFSGQDKCSQPGYPDEVQPHDQVLKFVLHKHQTQ
jgi:hypothetical protein